jgi:Ser/Thr protein kinase RdoA (MazF antagonist)
MPVNPFEILTPEAILTAVERATGLRLTGLTSPLPSYINRVYELRDVDGTKLIVKFYRPGRWTREAIEDELTFVADCQDAEVPVVPPMLFADGSLIAEHEGIFFALYPKRAGRQLEINDESDWMRIGALVARIHLAGQRGRAAARVTIHPQKSTLSDVEHLCSTVIPERMRERYRGIAMRLIQASAPHFEGLERIRIHGDCHRGNILDRLDEGLVVIDFDDMAMGPPVQDLWLLLPERVDKCRHEVDLFLQGYERFRQFDRSGLRCVEALRAMRMIYFLAWCSRQVDDYQFQRHFPNWGSDTFWQKEINDLSEQLGFVEEALVGDA